MEPRLSFIVTLCLNVPAARDWRDFVAHPFSPNVILFPQLVVDLLNPRAEDEARKHKLKRLVQGPNSFFMVRSLARRPRRNTGQGRGLGARGASTSYATEALCLGRATTTAPAGRDTACLARACSCILSFASPLLSFRRSLFRRLVALSLTVMLRACFFRTSSAPAASTSPPSTATRRLSFSAATALRSCARPPAARRD